MHKDISPDQKRLWGGAAGQSSSVVATAERAVIFFGSVKFEEASQEGGDNRRLT